MANQRDRPAIARNEERAIRRRHIPSSGMDIGHRRRRTASLPMWNGVANSCIDVAPLVSIQSGVAALTGHAYLNCVTEFNRSLAQIEVDHIRPLTSEDVGFDLNPIDLHPEHHRNRTIEVDDTIVVGAVTHWADGEGLLAICASGEEQGC